MSRTSTSNRLPSPKKVKPDKPARHDGRASTAEVASYLLRDTKGRVTNAGLAWFSVFYVMVHIFVALISSVIAGLVMQERDADGELQYPFVLFEVLPVGWSWVLLTAFVIPLVVALSLLAARGVTSARSWFVGLSESAYRYKHGQSAAPTISGFEHSHSYGAAPSYSVHRNEDPAL